ncbi:MAG: response regulator transcription factor [Flavobacteriales bacterium]|nr:response regulator transcription factor [Flavobacteriales bacterium]
MAALDLSNPPPNGHRQAASSAHPDTPIFNVALADDHPIVMDGIAAVLQRLSYVRVVVRATDGRQLLDALPKAGPIHLAFVDLSMPVMDVSASTIATSGY